MTTDLKFEVIEKPTGVVLSLLSALNDTVELPDLTKHSQIVVDFNNIKHVNSFGIKIWVQWLKQHRSVKSIILENCPYIFSRSFTVVAGMLQENILVNSLYIPYFSESTGERKDVLFKYKVDYDKVGFSPRTVVKDQNGEQMTIDVDPNKHFKFILK